MKTVTKQLKKITLLWILCLGANLAAQTVITIDNNPGSSTEFQTLQAAHNAAVAGDTIYVQPSETSYGNIIIDKPLIIVGRSHSELNNVSSADDITVRSSSVTIKGLKFDSFKSQTGGPQTTLPFTDVNVFECKMEEIQLGVSNTSPETVMDGVNIIGNVLDKTIDLTAFSDVTNVVISHNIIAGFLIKVHDPTGIVFSNNLFRKHNTIRVMQNFSSSETLVLFNNMFISNFFNDQFIDFNTGDFNLINNLTFNYGDGNVVFRANGSATFSESNNLFNTDPLFTDVDPSVNLSAAGQSDTYDPNAYPDDLTLQPSSPALTGGASGTEIGLFGNGFFYESVGNPRGIPTIEITNFQAAVPKNGTIQITIKAKAH